MTFRLLLLLCCFLAAPASAPAQSGKPSANAAAVPAAETEKEPPPPPKIFAQSAIIVDAISGQVLHEKNPDARREVASTQKLMTGLLIAEAAGLDREINVEDYETKCQPVKLFIRTGDHYKRRDLLRAMLLKSANDTARCLARGHAGSEEAFAKLMTSRAKKLGMKNTVFTNASGLPDDNQHSTARDMAKLACAALNHPVLRSIVATKMSSITMTDGREKELINTNRLLHEVSYVTGMKTGYTDNAGKCLISHATHRNRSIIVVVLGSSNSMIWKDSKSLIDWALHIPPTSKSN